MKALRASHSSFNEIVIARGRQKKLAEDRLFIIKQSFKSIDFILSQGVSDSNLAAQFPLAAEFPACLSFLHDYSGLSVAALELCPGVAS